MVYASCLQLDSVRGQLKGQLTRHASVSGQNASCGCLVCGRKSQPRYFQKAKSYEKEFKCCFGMVGRAIDAEDVIYEGGRR